MFPQAKSIITLLTGDPRDIRLFVTQSPREVIARVTRAKAGGDPLVTFDRILGNKAVQFSTQPTNVLNVEENS